MSAATKSSRVRAIRRFAWLREITEYVEASVTLPPVIIPTPMSNVASLDEERIEQLAEEVRDSLGLGRGPIANVVSVLEDHGVILSRVPLGAETLDAFSVWSEGGRPYVILSADKESAARSRFDAAHELGHMILHRHLDARTLHSRSDFKVIESQAHRFAAAFLLPASEFAADFLVPTLDALRELKSKWTTSIAMMIKRAQDLCLVPEDDARRLWIGLARRGWRMREPLDESMPIEMPSVLKESFDLLLGDGGETAAGIVAALKLAPNDIEDLAGLPAGFLSADRPGRLLALRTPGRLSDGSGGAGSRGDVLNFPGRPKIR